MPVCPNCATALNTMRQRDGLFFLCPNCHGRAVTFPQIRRVTGDRFVTSLLRQINAHSMAGNRPCPFCQQTMRLFSSSDPPLELDACKMCSVVWFDPQEFETVPEGAIESINEVRLRTAEEIATYRLEQLKQQRGDADAEPEEAWKAIPAIFGLPVETEASNLARLPWLTWSTVALLILASVYAWSNVSDYAERFGLIPSQLWRYGGLTLLTSFFLHAGVLHLVGNIYFLLVFGDNVEDFLGRWRWLLLLVLASLGGDLVHVLLEPHQDLPCVGASGGIAGILAFYALEFPRARLSFLCTSRRWVSARSVWISFPAWGAFALWLGLQILLALEQVSGFSTVSAAAHLGGAAVGFGLWCVWRKVQAPKGA